MAFSHLKRGKEARKEAKHIDADRKRRKEERENEIRRFFVKRGTERRVTFLDGDLDSNGELELVAYMEHNLMMNGHWRNFFPCPGNDEEPCPICEERKLPAHVAVFTVIDHTKYKDREGKEHKDQKMLLVAKRKTQQILEAIAVKRGGLAGITFDIMRVDEDQSPAVGTMFDFIDKEKVKRVIKKYGIEPYDYDEIITFKSHDDLRKEGFGKEDKLGDEPDPDVDDDDDDDADSGGMGLDGLDEDEV